MSHEIFGDRFLSYRQPAWHGLGLVIEEQVGAREALQRIGPYEVKLLPLAATLDGRQIPIETHKGIVRLPTEDDSEARVFGVVRGEYALIDPQQLVDIWDEFVAAPVETIAALKHGSVMFISTKLPSWEVRGDQIDDYLLLHNPMNGWQAAQVLQTQVRVVCNNTLRMALQQAGANAYTVVHDSTARERLGRWLAEMYEGAAARAAAIREAYEILAAHRVTEPEAQYVLEAAYPMPKPPRENAPAEVMRLREEDYERHRERAVARRAAALGLFEGAGVGMDAPAAAGTAWGLYNAVVETEDYRRWVKLEAKAYDTLYGNRAEAKERAFAACLEISKN